MINSLRNESFRICDHLLPEFVIKGTVSTPLSELLYCNRDYLLLLRTPLESFNAQPLNDDLCF